MALKKVSREVSWMKLVATISLAVLIFLIGIGIGYFITESKISEILSLEKETRFELESLIIQDQLLEEYPCKDINLLTGRVDDLGTKLTFLESQYNKNDPKILELKKPYTLLQVRHYLAMKKMVDKCGYNYSLVLFFYSNSPEEIRESEEQGFVLDYLRKKYRNIKIYSFDAELDMDVISYLLESYEIAITPSTVIDDKVYVGFHGKEELSKVFERD
jgi:hypothetical protein